MISYQFYHDTHVIYGLQTMAAVRAVCPFYAPPRAVLSRRLPL